MSRPIISPANWVDDKDVLDVVHSGHLNAHLRQYALDRSILISEIADPDEIAMHLSHFPCSYTEAEMLLSKTISERQNFRKLPVYIQSQKVLSGADIISAFNDTKLVL